MIENIDFTAFVKENIAFVKTMIIKHEMVANLDNALIEDYYHVKPGSDKTKWRYYMNLNGEYHFSDQMMTVKSLDNNEIIEFTKENLAVHPATKNAYRQGGYYYSRLTDEYPHQTDLIGGILNPIPIQEAIDAKDNQILRYNLDYVEWNEIQLIPELQKYIDNHVYQNFGTEYIFTDNLVPPALLVDLRSNILQFVLTNRFENRFTRYAHSFYIWSLVQSVGINIYFKEYLNEKQTMWLFRNIEYTLRNLGKEDMFKQLINILLSERSIPLSKYDMVYNTSNMPDDLSTNVAYQSERLNMIEMYGLARTLKSIRETMIKEIPEAYDNNIFYDKYLPTTEHSTRYGEEGNYPIKVLESEMVDTTNRQPETIYHVINSELIYLAKNNLYDISIDFTEPQSGNEFTMPVRDAIVLWHHLLDLWLGNDDCDKILHYTYFKALKITPPSVKELMSLGGHPFLEQDWCTALYNTHIPQFRIISPTAFYLNARDIFNLKWDHKKMVARFPSIGYYSRRDNAVSDMYETGIADFSKPFGKYSKLLEYYSIDLTDYSKEDYSILMWEIWKKMTGWDQFRHQTVAELQEGMIGLMRFLSSYSVQYVHQTDIQTGYYQGGLDLLTENPMNLSPNGPQIEQETENTQIEIPHRVVTKMEEEGEMTGYIEQGGMSSYMVLTERGNIYSTPVLFDSELNGDSPEEPLHVGNAIKEGFNLRNFEGELPWDIDHLIPEGSLYNDQQFTRGLIIDVLTGFAKEGPWVVDGMKIVDNNLDNTIVAKELNGYPLPLYAASKPFVGEDGKERYEYRFGFVPKEVGKHAVKLDILLSNSKDNSKTTLRVDYPIKVSEGLWNVVLDIPESININEPFDISTVFTNLDVKEGERLETSIVANDTISQYLVLGQNELGEATGTFVKTGWPDELPVLLTASIFPKGTNSVKDLGVRQRFMIGYVPSDRFYDPVYDKDFIPKASLGINQRQGVYAGMLGEKFKVIKSKKGWESVSIDFKLKDDGSYPDGILTSYNGFEGVTKPIISKLDETVEGGVTFNNYSLYFSYDEGAYPAGTKFKVPMVLTLYSESTQTTVKKEFDYEFIMGDLIVFSLNDDSLAEVFPINYNTISDLTFESYTDVNGSWHSNSTLIPKKNWNDSLVTLTSSSNPNNFGKLDLNPTAVWTEDHQWLAVMDGRVSGYKGLTFDYKAFDVIDINKDRVLDTDKIEVADFELDPWGTWASANLLEIVKHRYNFKDTINGWAIDSVAVSSSNSFLKTRYSVSDILQSIRIDIPSPILKHDKDGSQELPSGKDGFFTVAMIGGSAGKFDVVLELTATNKYTGKKFNFTINDPLVCNNVTLKAVTDQEFIIYDENTPLPCVFNDVPSGIYTKYSASKLNVIGSVLYPDATTYTWDESTKTIYVNMPPRKSANSKGLYFYNERTFAVESGDYVGTSLAERTFISELYFSNDNILPSRPPKMSEFEPLALGNDFYVGVTSYDVIIVNNKVSDWIIDSFNMECYGASNESDFIDTMPLGDPANKNYAYNAQVLNGSWYAKNKNAMQLGFTPSKAGKQTYPLNVKLRNTADGSTYVRKYDYVATPADNPNLTMTLNDEYWFGIGLTTRAVWKTNGSVVPKFASANINLFHTSDSSLMTSADGSSSYDSTNGNILTTFPIKVLKQPDADIKFTATLVTQNNGFVISDNRRIKVLYPTGVVDKDLCYNPDDVGIEDFELNPDIIFPNRITNETRTERYSYNKAYRGWYFSAITTVDTPDEVMLNYYQDGLSKSIPVLVSCSLNNDYDNTPANPAPAGRQFMFPNFGFNTPGTFKVKYRVSLSGRYHTGSKYVYFELERTAVKSDITVKVDPVDGDKLFVGKVNNVKYPNIGIPQPDLPAWITGSATNILFVGTEGANFSAPTTNTVSVSNDYDGGKVKVIYYVNYNSYRNGEIPAGHIKSNTEHRQYAAEYVLDDSQIGLDPAEFAIKPMGVWYRELTATREPIFFNKSWNGWTVESVRFKPGTEDDSIMKEYNGLDLMYGAFYSFGGITSVNKVEGYTTVMFMPNKVGDSVKFPMELVVSNNGRKLTVPFDLVKLVKPRPTSLPSLNIVLGDSYGKRLSPDNPIYVGVSNRRATIYELNVDGEYTVNLSTNGPFDVAGYKNEYMKINKSVSSPTGGYVAFISCFAKPTEDFNYYNYYSMTYQLNKYGKNIYNPTTIRQISTATIMETKIDKDSIQPAK